MHRKFEIAELCHIFFNRYMKIAYLVVLCVHNFLARWVFATVAGSAWASNIPFGDEGIVTKCDENAFQHTVLPFECLFAYYISLAIFAVIVVTLSLFDVKEQAFIQFLLGVLRFITIAAMVIYCIVRLAGDGDACLDVLGITNITGNGNFSESINIEMASTVFKFGPKGWLLAFPIFTYGFVFHTGLSSLSHPIKQKKYIHWFLFAVFAMAFVTYLLLGLVVALWFRASIQETSTLNWVSMLVCEACWCDSKSTYFWYFLTSPCSFIKPTP